jgi:hypothetical protein
MDVAIATPAAWNHEVSQTPTVEQLIRHAMTVVDGHSLPITPAKVSRLVRAQIRKLGGVRAAAVDIDAYFLNYTDITGETAAANVDHQRQAANR